MTAEPKKDVLQLATELHEYIADGRIIDAMHDFYAEEVVMRDNMEEPCRGLAANLEREQAWLDGVAEWRGFEVKAISAVGNTTFAETTMDFVTTDGQTIHSEQVARAIWKDGKIVDERFYRV